jgi:hypothetical protein
VGKAVSVQGVTSLVIAVSGLVIAVKALWHSIQTRNKIK